MPPIMGAAAFIMAELLARPTATSSSPRPCRRFFIMRRCSFRPTWRRPRATSPRCRARNCAPCARCCARAGISRFPSPSSSRACSGFNLSPDTAALYASGSLIVCGLFGSYGGKRMRPLDVIEALVETGRSSLDILMIAAAAGFIIGVLNVSGLNFALTMTLIHLGAGNAALLLVLAAGDRHRARHGHADGRRLCAACFAGRAGADPGRHPRSRRASVRALFRHDVDDHAAGGDRRLRRREHRPGRPDPTGFAGVRFGWSAYIVPFLFVSSPTLLMQGPIPDVVLAVGTAIMGVYLVSVAVAGFMTRPVGFAIADRLCARWHRADGAGECLCRGDLDRHCRLCRGRRPHRIPDRCRAQPASVAAEKGLTAALRLLVPGNIPHDRHQ